IWEGDQSMTPEKTRMSKDKAVPTPIAVVEILKERLIPSLRVYLSIRIELLLMLRKFFLEYLLQLHLNIKFGNYFVENS
ncbi:hypothetical protein, partial [Enterococcus casseliflavus]